MNWKRIIKTNYAQLFFVFFTFSLMVLVSYFSISAIVKRHLVVEVKEAIHVVEANIRMGLSEAETTMNNAAHNVQSILDGGGTQNDVASYLSSTTKLMQGGSRWLLGFHRIYGHIRGEMVSGPEIDPNPEFLPQTRPWFDAAVKNPWNRYSIYTEPYTDADTGDTVITVVRNIYGKSDKYYGLIAIDMDLSWASKYIKSLENTQEAYGMILTRDMIVVGHPYTELIGRRFCELSDGYQEICHMLATSNVISSVPTVNAKGQEVMASFKKMFNGWSVGVITPVESYYRDVYRTALILSALGIVSMSILSYILIKLSAAKIHSDEESKSKSSFLARMSHEIRTPMNAIIGMSELAQREHGTDKALEYIAGIKSASANLLAIINDILDFSKIESGQFTLAPAPYEPASLLNDALGVVRIRLGEKPIELCTRIDPSLPAGLVGDAVRVRQILLNVLSNAVKYTDRGFIRFSVSWQEIPGDAALLIFTVADSGIGIRSENLSRLFGDFVRVEEQRSIEGTGLGLAITRNLCRAMGGDITVESEYGKGSVFTATLRQPIADRRPMGSLENKIQAQKATPRISFTAPDADILLADDMASNLLVAEGLLAPYKARVVTCQSGYEAVELARSRPFDLIFMDHMMPGMDGMEATAAIRALGERGKMPIVALTANAVAGMREMFLQNGFSDFLSKPIEIPKLAEIMEKWIPADKRGPAPPDAAAPSGGAEAARLPVIEGVNTLIGQACVGGVRSRYLDLLETFRRDARTRLPLLTKAPKEEECKTITMQAHALKSALAAIGAAGLAADAARLEDAGRNGDFR
jgi:signal transduction histidine kinase/CheY-like chemotaxis protein/HPt (histidine-containing phosphotransfer) domain-containing protein